MDGLAQFLPLLQQGHEKGGYLIGVAGIFTGGCLLHHSVLGVGHDLAPQMGGFDFDNVAPILKDGSGLAHQAFEFVLESECIFHIHGSYLLCHVRRNDLMG